MAFDILVRTLYTDNGLSAGLAKANAQLTQIGRAGPGARTGLKAVETGARQLAFSAAGLSGPMGTIARGMLQIGGGNALVLGAVAGLGLVAGAYNLLTKGAREAKKEQDDFVASLRQVGPHAVALAERMKLVGLETQRSFSKVPAWLLPTFNALGMSTGGMRGEDRAKLEQDIATQKIAVANAERAAADAAERQADAIGRSVEQARRLRLEAIEFLQIQIQLERGGVFPLLSRGFTAPGFGPGAGTTALGLPVPGQAHTFANIRANVPRFVPDPFPKREGVDRQAIAQMALMSLMMGARGGASGAFGAAGGLLSGISGLKGVGAGLAGPLGWAGFGLSAIGGIFGLFNNDEERRHKEMIQAMRDLRPIIEQARVTRIIVSPTGQFIAQTEHEIGRREDRDAVDRDGRSI